jgi:outer membrane protein TolC
MSTRRLVQVHTAGTHSVRLALSGAVVSSLLATTLAFAQAPTDPVVPPKGTEATLPPPTDIPAVKPMTLADALAYAHAHEPAIRTALAQVATAQANAKVPRAAWQPTFAASAQLFAATSNNTTASYLVTDDMAVPRIGGTTSVSQSGAGWQPYASSFVGVSALQEVFDFGTIAARTAVADATVVVAKHNADAERLDVELGVEEAYFGVYAAKGVLKASEDAYERGKTHRDLAKAGVQSGLRSPIELTRAEATLAQYDIGRIRAKGGVAIAQSVLAASIGAPEMAVDVSGPAPASADLPSLADGIRAAAAKDPLLQEAIARLSVQEKNTTAIGAALRPNLFATGTLSGRAGGETPSGAGIVPDGSGFLPDVPNWDVGLVLSWTVFDGVTVASRNASRVAESARKEEIALYREREVAAVTQGYVRVSVARDAVPALQDAVRGALANYAQADARFRSGLGNAVELADAEELRTNAEVQLALGLFEVARARAIFGRAIAEGL